MLKLNIKVSKSTKDALEVQALENRRSAAAEGGLILDQYFAALKNPPKTVPYQLPAPPPFQPQTQVVREIPAPPPPALTEVPDMVLPAVPAFTGS
jgi:hypothetical protein